MTSKVDELRQHAKRAQNPANSVSADKTALALRVAAEKLNEEAGKLEYEERTTAVKR